MDSSVTVIEFGAHKAVLLRVNNASGLWNTVMVSDTKVLSQLVAISPTVSTIIYVESVVLDVFVSVKLFWCEL